jgi:hypothetical protein
MRERQREKEAWRERGIYEEEAACSRYRDPYIYRGIYINREKEREREA